MSHPEELLAGYVDGTLPEADRAAVEAHLESCATCREELDHAHEAVRALAALPREPAPPGLAEGVIEAAAGAAGSGAGKGARRYRVAAVLAAAAVVALIAVTLPHLGGSNSTKDQTAAENAGNQPGVASGGVKAGNVPPLEIASINFNPMTAGHLIKTDALNAPVPGLSYGNAGSGVQTASPAQAQAALSCLERAFTGFTGEPTRLIQAKFQGRPAYVGIYTERPGPGLPPNGVSVRVASIDTCVPLTITSAKTKT